MSTGLAMKYSQAWVIGPDLEVRVSWGASDDGSPYSILSLHASFKDNRRKLTADEAMNLVGAISAAVDKLREVS